MKKVNQDDNIVSCSAPHATCGSYLGKFMGGSRKFCQGCVCVGGGGGGAVPDLLTFLVINKFHRLPYEPPLRVVHIIISKETIGPVKQ